MKKKKIANLIMVVLIAVILVSGIFTVGHLRGWFDSRDGDAYISDIWGTCTVTRQGVAYAPEKGMVLRQGDELQTGHGTILQITTADGRIALYQDTVMTVEVPDSDAFDMHVELGELFVSAGKKAPITIRFEDRQTSIQEAAGLLAVRYGSCHLDVLDGAVTCEQTAEEGYSLSWVGKELQIVQVHPESLNEFAIGQIRLANETGALCFSNEQLDAVEEERRIAMQDMVNRDEIPTIHLDGSKETVPETLPPETEADAPETESAVHPDATEETSRQPENTDPVPTEKDPTAGQTEPENPAESKPTSPTAPKPTPPKPTTPKPTSPKPTKPEPTRPPVTTVPETTVPETTLPPQPAAKGICYLEIRCDTILKNRQDLNPEKAGYVPADGIILNTIAVEFTTGESVFDVLVRVCNQLGIQIEYSWTPMYNSHYIEGIHHLYEFDCGSLSGWMYKVNGQYPDFGCTRYILKDQDLISWNYTCDCGVDLGEPQY